MVYEETKAKKYNRINIKETKTMSNVKVLSQYDKAIKEYKASIVESKRQIKLSKMLIKQAKTSRKIEALSVK